MKRLLKNIIIFSGILFFTACTDLDLNPLSEGSSENWYSDETELKMTVQSLYHINFWRKDQDSWTDDFTIRQSVRPIVGGTLNSGDAIVGNTWSQCYKAIAMANDIVNNIDRLQGIVTEENLNKYLGEARFVRASEYALLISHFGDVPYYDKPLDIDEAFALSRTDKNTILEKIYQDYDFAASVLPDEYSGSDTKRATRGSALALKSRIALYMGDYATARDAAKACMDLNVFSLEPNFGDIYQTDMSNEWIFSLPRSVELGVWFGWGPTERLPNEPGEEFSVPHHLPRNRGGYAMMDPSWDLLLSFLCTDGLPIDESPLFNPQEPFKNRDPRCSETIVEHGTEFLGVVFQPHPDSVMTYSYLTGGYIKNNDSRVNTQYASYNGLIWKKSITEEWADDTYADPEKIIIRYADVLLMYAEANIELGNIDQSVLDAINQVRSRAYNGTGIDYPQVTTTNQSELRRIVRVERRMEFAFEGRRYMDLIRWRLAEKALNIPIYGMLNVSELRSRVVQPGLWFFPFTPDVDDDGIAILGPMYDAGYIRQLAPRNFDTRQYLWPIPSKEIKINENLEQNTGY